MLILSLRSLRLVDFEPPILPAYVPHGAAAPPRFFWKWSEWSSRHGCICASSQQNSCGRARACRAASVYWLGFSGARKDVCVNLTTLWESDIEMAIPFVRLKTRKGLESCSIPHYNFPGSYVWFTRKQSQTCMHSKHDKCWSINYFSSFRWQKQLGEDEIMTVYSWLNLLQFCCLIRSLSVGQILWRFLRGLWGGL